MSADEKIKALALAWFRADRGSYTYAHIFPRDRSKMLSDFEKSEPDGWQQMAAVFLRYLEFEGFTISKLPEKDK